MLGMEKSTNLKILKLPTSEQKRSLQQLVQMSILKQFDSVFLKVTLHCQHRQ